MKNWSKYKPEEFEYRGKWIDNWFSNMSPSPFTLEGIEWPSVENYYQAMKSTDRNDWIRFSKMTPSESKRAGRELKNIRPNWDVDKRTFMFKGLLVKFNQPEWKEKLLATGKEMLIEWNNWGDKIWGVTIDDCEGENMLGDILMNIRTAFQYDLIEEEYGKVG